MMLGLGQTTTTTSAAPVTTTCTQATTLAASPTFMNGVSLWACPGTALQVMGTIFNDPNMSTDYFSSATLGATLGILTPPIAILGLLLMMAGRGGKR